jgi:hypothetical protein
MMNEPAPQPAPPASGSGLPARVWAALWRLEPFRHARWERVIIRFIFALLVWDTQTGWIAHWNDPPAALRGILTYASRMDIRHDSQPHPNGIATLVDLTFFADDRVEYPLRYAMGASLAAWVLGAPGALALAIPVFLCLGSATLNNSQGSIGHTAQGIHLALLAAWLAGIYAWWQRRRGRELKFGYHCGELEIDWARQALVATYVVSAISKLILSKGAWFADAKFFALHVLKNNEMQYYNTLDPALRQLHWLPEWMLAHPVTCQWVFGLALPLELLAFMALRNRRAALLFGLALAAFHQSVTELTQLSFIFNKLLLITLLVTPWWWIARLLPGPSRQTPGFGR